MNITRIDSKCSRCMLCVRDCVSGVWRLVDGVPEPVDPSLCNLCSHCLAVCPRGAILHDKLDADQVTALDKKKVSAAAYRETVLGRRSVRNFRDREVPHDVIEQILDLAHHSPTASNQQSVGYIVVTDRELIKKVAKKIYSFALGLYMKTQKGLGLRIARATGLSQNRYLKVMEYIISQVPAGRDFILHNAPVVILVHSPKKGSFMCDNCNIAAANIMNYSHAMGLGTCIIGFLTLALRFSKNIRTAFGVPAGRRVHASIVLGYPAYPHPRTVSRKQPDITWL
jgi:nitroreductase/NAD-dependent dihydropyrimidine dehydrogenase PreA subunit